MTDFGYDPAAGFLPSPSMATSNPWVYGITPAPDDRYLPGFYADRFGDHVAVGPRLKEEFLHVQYSLYGIPIPITVGVRRLTGNMVWAATLQEIVNTWHDGGSDDHSATLYSYLANFAVSFGVADPLINPSHATTALTIPPSAGIFDYKNALPGETVTIGVETYTWKTVVVDPNDVLIGLGSSASLRNIIAAVNGGAGAGTAYGTGTVANADCSATYNGQRAIFTANVLGSAGAALVSTETMKYGSFGAAHFQYNARKVLRVWANGSLIVDRTGTGQVMPIGVKLEYVDGPLAPPVLVPTNSQVEFTFYPGSETQEPDPTILDKENTRKWTGYRGQMYCVFKNFPIEFFGNNIPLITIEIGDSTSLKTQAYVMDASPQPNGSMLATDLKAGLCYANNPGPLYQYDLDQNVLLTKLTLDAARSDASTIVPWNGNLVTADAALDVYQRFSIVDAASGATLQELGTTASSTGAGGVIEQPHHFVPVRIPTPAGPVEAYVCCSVFKDIQIVVADIATGALQLAYEDAALKPVLSIDELNCGCPGQSLTSSQIVYVGVNSSSLKGVFRLVLDGSLQGGVGVTGGPKDSLTPWYVPIDGYHPRQMVYDEVGRSLIVMLDKSASPTRIENVDPDTGEVLWRQDIPYKTASVGQTFWQSNVLPGFLATIKDGVDAKVLEIDLSDGTYTEYDMTDDDSHGGGIFGHGSIPSMLECVGDAGSQSLTGFDASGDLKRVYYNRLNDARTTLKYFLEFMAGQIDLVVPDEFEVSVEVDDAIDGGIINEPVRFRTLVDSLSTIYRLDVIEHGDQILIVRKTLDVDGAEFDIASSSLLELQPGDPTEFVIRRETDVDMPNAVQLTFLDKAMNYNPNFAFAKRSNFPIPTSHSVDPLQLSMPLIITAKEAKELCYLMLYRAWATKDSQSFRMGPEFIQIEPGDIGNVSDGELGWTVKVTQTTINADLSIGIQAQSFLTDAPIDVAAEEPPPWVPPPWSFTRTTVIPVDCVLLHPGEDSAISGADAATMYFMISPQAHRAWRGGSAQYGLSPSDYKVVGTSTFTPCIGHTVNALATVANPFMTDIVNYLDIQLSTDTSDQLVSISDLELFGYVNIALVGKDNRWEVIQFRDVADLGDNKFRLTHLLRGRKGSEDNVGNHAKGDTFLFLGGLKSQSISAESLGRQLFYRGYSINQAPADGITSSIKWDAESAKPLRPCQPKAVISGPDVVLSWKRRTRGSGEWLDGTGSVSVFETVDSFVLTFYSDAIHSTVLGTIESDLATGAGSLNPEECTLDATAQTDIFGGSLSSGDPVYVQIRQRGSVTGVFGRNLDATLVVT